MISKIVKTAAFAGLALCALSSYAATVQLVGDTVTYEYDDQQAALALFGTPTIIGDGVRFLPPSFRAQSVDGAGTDVVFANFIFSNVYTHTGNTIQAIGVSEFGDYKITNGDSVSADLLLTVSSNTSLDPNNLSSDSASFDTNGDSVGLQLWDLSVLVDPSLDFLNPTNNVAVIIQNTLTATTDAFGEVAWIQKQLAFIASEDSGVLPPSEVPVPAAAWLFGSGLLGLVGLARRKRS
jgi:hypothetical protein